MQTLKAIIIPFWLTAILAVACIKESNQQIQHPAMHYTDLHDAEIKSNQLKQIDIDGDGSNDVNFHTLLVGDPVLQRDRRQFLVNSTIGVYLLNNSHDESPKLGKGEAIKQLHEGYNWYEISSIVLAEKIIPLNGSIYWDGLWKNASHQYLPIEIIKNGHFYLGWIEISFDVANEKLILHKAAIATEADAEIKAGY